MKSSTKDKAGGKMSQVKGKIKEVVGKVVGNKEMEAEGKAEILKGNIQDDVGDIKKDWGK